MTASCLESNARINIKGKIIFNNNCPLIVFMKITTASKLKKDANKTDLLNTSRNYCDVN